MITQEFLRLQRIDKYACMSYANEYHSDLLSNITAINVLVNGEVNYPLITDSGVQ